MAIPATSIDEYSDEEFQDLLVRITLSGKVDIVEYEDRMKHRLCNYSRAFHPSKLDIDMIHEIRYPFIILKRNCVKINL